MSSSLFVAALLVLTALSSAAQEPGPRPARAADQVQDLRIVESVPLAIEAGIYAGGFLCDPAGNVYYVPVASSGGRDNRAPDPDTVVRVSSDGRVATRFHLPSLLGIGGQEGALRIRGVAVDARGVPHALLSLRDSAGAQDYLVSFADGQAPSKIRVDNDRVRVGYFGAFGTGEFLLWGSHGQEEEPLLAVMAKDGRSLRNVIVPVGKNDRTALRQGPPAASHVASGGDGLVYIWNDGQPVYGISASGKLVATIELVPPPGAGQLVQLKASGKRLAAIYDEGDPAAGQSARWWMATYDVSSGRRLAFYGPVQRIVMCYGTVGAADHFGLLGARDGQHYLYEASPK